MSDLPNLYLTDVGPSSDKEEAVILKKQRSRHRRESMKTNDIEQIPREVDFLAKVSAKNKTKSGDKKGGKHISFQSPSQPSKQSEKKIAKFEKLYKTPHNSGAGKTGKGTGNKKGAEKKNDQRTKGSFKDGKKTGKETENIEKKIEASSQNVPPSVENETVIVADVDVAEETVEKETSVKDVKNGAENERDSRTAGESEVTETDQEKEGETDKTSIESEERRVSEVKSTLTSESKLKDRLGDDGIEAPVSTLSMKSPSLPQVTPQPSGFRLVSDSVRSGALPADDETASNSHKPSAGSPCSAIFRMISMRETRESCDLSPESSYVVLPTLTSSEGTLINSRMTELLKNDESRSKGLESSSPSFPALTSTPSKETHAETSITADHTNDLVKLPSVPSVEPCPSRSPTPVRSPSRSSQVALPQIGMENN